MSVPEQLSVSPAGSLAAPPRPAGAAPVRIEGRRPDLDVIRVTAFALLILYHVGLFYVSWDWHAKSPRASAAIEPLMWLTSPWRLTLLFLVSGCAMRFMVDRGDAPPRERARALAADRSLRLLPPLLFGMLVLVPPQAFVEAVEKGVAPGGYLQFWGAFLLGTHNYRLHDGGWLFPVTNHLWFVLYIWVYALLLAGLIAGAPRLLRAAEAWLERRSALWLMLAPIAWMAALRLWAWPVFGQTNTLPHDPYNHLLSGSAVLFGFLVARSPVVADRFAALRWPALAAGAVAWALYAAGMGRFVSEQGAGPGLCEAMRVTYAVQAWGAIVAMLGFARVHVRRTGPVLRYLTLAVFPFYLVHQTAIVLLGHGLARLHLPLPVEAPLLIAGTAVCCWAAYELAKRAGPLRVVFGLKAEPAGVPAARGVLTRT